MNIQIRFHRTLVRRATISEITEEQNQSCEAWPPGGDEQGRACVPVLRSQADGEQW